MGSDNCGGERRNGMGKTAYSDPNGCTASTIVLEMSRDSF
jgi:hypothetical protein